MLDDMDIVDFHEKKEQSIQYLRYAVFLVPIILIISIINAFVVTYSDVEDEIIKLAKNYVKENSLKVAEGEEEYLPLGLLGEVEGAEFCSNASGVIITNKKNRYRYKAYLKCNDYETKLVSNSDKYINLNGENVTILNLGEIYDESGYYLNRATDVEVEGEVGVTPGIYTIKYKTFVDSKEKQTLTRKVIITKYDKSSTNSGVVKSEKPTIILRGDTKMLIEKGEKYVEPGYKAIDYDDGVVTKKVKVEGEINNQEIGTYKLVYSVTNSKNQTIEKTREIEVVNKKGDVVIESSLEKQSNGLYEIIIRITGSDEVVNKKGDVVIESSLEKQSNGLYEIIIRITGSDYDKTVLPADNSGKTSETNAKRFSYSARQNKEYAFIVIDKYNNSIIHKVNVNSIDLTPPSGSCIASVYSDRIQLYANATDKSGVKSYQFFAGDNAIGTKFNSVTKKDIIGYSYNGKVEKFRVQVFDTVGNSTFFTCSINDFKNRGTTTGGIMNIPLILQTNYTKPIKWYGGTTTVRGYGCGPTSVSMVVAYLTGNKKQDPQIIFEWLTETVGFGGYGWGTPNLSRAAARYGVTCVWKSKMTETELKATLLEGKPMIVLMGGGTFIPKGNRHYIVLKGVTDDGKIAVNDPFSEKRSKATYDAQTILNEAVKGTSSFGTCY